jgi:hypothetical protein
MRAILPLVSRGHFTDDRAAKKNPAYAGLSVACLCGGASSRCYPVRAVSGDLLLFRTRHFFCLLPWLACFPKVRLRR